MSRICSDLFKTYLLCPHFLTSIYLGSSGFKTNHPNASPRLHRHELREKKITTLNPESRDWTLAGRQITAHSICVWRWFSGAIIYLCGAFSTAHAFSTHHRRGEAMQHDNETSCSAWQWKGLFPARTTVCLDGWLKMVC